MNKSELLIKLMDIEEILNTWLVDRTVHLFEEEPEIDQARGLLNDLLFEIELDGVKNEDAIDSE